VTKQKLPAPRITESDIKHFADCILISAHEFFLFFSIDRFAIVRIYPGVAKVGGLQSQGAKGKAVVVYCEPLTTLDLEPSGFPEG